MNLIPQINDLVVSNASKAKAGVRSGLNEGKSLGFGRLMGTKQLGLMGSYAGATSKRLKRAGKAIPRNEDGTVNKAGRNAAMMDEGKKRAWRAAKMAGGYFSGSDLAGEGGMRALGVGLRGAAGYAAMQTADFLNPFGFGSIND